MCRHCSFLRVERYLTWAAEVRRLRHPTLMGGGGICVCYTTISTGSGVGNFLEPPQVGKSPFTVFLKAKVVAPIRRLLKLTILQPNTCKSFPLPTWAIWTTPWALLHWQKQNRFEPCVGPLSPLSSVLEFLFQLLFGRSIRLFTHFWYGNSTD